MKSIDDNEAFLSALDAYASASTHWANYVPKQGLVFEALSKAQTAQYEAVISIVDAYVIQQVTEAVMEALKTEPSP